MINEDAVHVQLMVNVVCSSAKDEGVTVSLVGHTSIVFGTFNTKYKITESVTVHQGSSMPRDIVAIDEVWLTLSMNINSRNERYCRSEHYSAVHAVSLPKKVPDWCAADVGNTTRTASFTVTVTSDHCI